MEKTGLYKMMITLWVDRTVSLEKVVLQPVTGSEVFSCLARVDMKFKSRQEVLADPACTSQVERLLGPSDETCPLLEIQSGEALGERILPIGSDGATREKTGA